MTSNLYRQNRNHVSVKIPVVQVKIFVDSPGISAKKTGKNQWIRNWANGTKFKMAEEQPKKKKVTLKTEPDDENLPKWWVKPSVIYA